MAANIFELIIKGEGLIGGQESTNEVEVYNGNLFMWVSSSYVDTFGYDVPQVFVFDGLAPLPEIAYNTSLYLYNETFNQAFYDIYVNVWYTTLFDLNDSFFVANGWSFNMFTLANDGLDAANTNEVEHDTTPGFSYYKPTSHYVMPDLTIYGRKSSVDNMAQRVGLTLSPQYIPDTSDVHPNNITDKMNEIYLTSLHVAGSFALRHDQRINYGSIRSQNLLTHSEFQSQIFVNDEGLSSRIIRVVDLAYVLYSLFCFSFNKMNVLFYQYLTENPNLLLTKKKFTDIPSTSFPTYGNGVSCDYPLPPTIISLENIFQPHTLGKNVELEIKINSSEINLPSQDLVGCYTDGAVDGSGFYNDIQSTSVLYSIDSSSNLTGTADGKWFPKSFSFNQAFDQNTANAPVRAELATSQKMLFFGGQFSNASQSVARVEKTLLKSTTYNVSFNVETCNHGAKVMVYAIGSSNEIVEALTDEIDIAVNSATDAEAITHFTFNTHISFDRVALEVTLTQDLPEMSFIRINYVRFEKSTFGIVHRTVDYIRNTASGVDEPQVTPTSFASFNNTHGTASAAPVVVTTSELTKYPLSYTRFIAPSPNYEEVRYFDDGFAPDSDVKSDVENLILPFSNADGVFSASESQLIPSETHNITLLNNSDLTDSDGCYSPDLYATIRLNLVVGSKDLHIFTDTLFGDAWVNSRIQIKEIKFFDSENSFITRNGASDNKIRLKYDPTNGVAAPNAVQSEQIPETHIGSNVSIEYKVDSLSGGDSLRVDFGNGTQSLEIASAGTSSGTIIAEGSQLRIRPETESEKGSALTGLDAVIDYVKVKVAQSGNQVILEKVGDPSSLNSALNYVGAYDVACRVKNVNVQNLNLAAGIASATLYFSVETVYLQGANQVDLTIDTMYLSSGSSIVVTERFDGSENTTTISSTSTSSNLHTITRNNIPDVLSAGDGQVAIQFKTTSSSDTLDAYLNNITLSATFGEAPIQGKTDISLDLSEDFEIALNASIKDYRDLQSSSSSFSKTLTIPATSKNKLAFNFQNELQSLSNKYSVTSSFNQIKPLRFLLKGDGVELFSGMANLLGSSLDEHGTYELEANLVSGNADWVEMLKEIELKTLSSSTYEISSDAIIEGALNPSLNHEICFPLVDNGKWKVRDSSNPDAVNVSWGNIKAAFSIRVVFEKIFEQVGYSLVSDFFNENNEYSDEFSPEFGSFKDRLLGIAPSMSKPDFFIQRTSLNISFDPSLATGANQGVPQFSAFKGNEGGIRPHIKNSYLGFDLGALNPRAYHLDWAFINCNVVNQDKGGFHSTENIGLTETLGGVEFITSAPPASNKYKLKGNNLGQAKSVIEISSSDYYNLDIAINFTLTRVAGTGDSAFHASEALNGAPGFETFVTVILVDSEFANDNLYKEYGLAFNAFDLFDKTSVELLRTDYENTRVSLSRNQYLEVGKKYNIVALMGTRSLSTTLDSEEVVFNCGFQVNELDLSLEVCKNVAPMEGRYFAVYNEQATPKVSYLEVLPDVKAIEFISEVTKIFNLNWATNNLTQEVTVEPFSQFYDFEGSVFPFKDFTEKALITKVSNNEIVNTDLVYAMKDDSSDYSIKESSQSDLSLSFGDKKVYLSLNGLSNTASLSSENKGVSLGIFSALQMGNAKFITRTNSGNVFANEVSAETQNLKTKTVWIPRIWSEPESTLEPMLPEEKPDSNNSHEYKLCMLKGTKYTDESLNYINSALYFNNSISNATPCVHYSLEESFSYYNQGIYSSGAGSGLFRYNERTHPVYLEVGSYFPSEPNTPSAMFSDVQGSSGTEGALFNEYHQKLIDMLMMRDKIVTAEIYLTSEDMRSLNFRQLIKIDSELYIINKVKDFNFSGEPTEVELLLVTRTGTNHEIL